MMTDTPGPEVEPTSGAERWIWLWILLPVAILGAWAWTLGAECRALRAMNPEARTVLFERTRAATESLCTAGSDLREACRTEAERLQRFPECDEPCQRFVSKQLAQPVR